MCDECGCEEEEGKEKNVLVNESVMDENDKIASKVHHELMHKKVLPINIMGSPGSGKTTFIQQIARLIGAEEIAVIQGDLESDIDKEKLEKEGIYTEQINTHSGCHLNAEMIKKSVEEMDLEDKKFLLIENVGNLVCPADIKIGQELNVVISSTTEGSDKPAKYPVIFQNADLVVVTKFDIAEHVDFNLKEYEIFLQKIKPMEIIKASIKDEDGFRKSAEFLKKKYDNWVEKTKTHKH